MSENERMEMKVIVHQSQITKAVRQLLANEWGLNDGKMRAMIDARIQAVLDKYIDHLMQQEKLTAMVALAVSRHLARAFLG